MSTSNLREIAVQSSVNLAMILASSGPEEPALPPLVSPDGAIDDATTVRDRLLAACPLSTAATRKIAELLIITPHQDTQPTYDAQQS